MKKEMVNDMAVFADGMAEILDILKQEKKRYKNYLSQEAVDAGNSLVQMTQGLRGAAKDLEDVKHAVLELLKKELPHESPYMAVWWYSVLLSVKKDPSVFLEFVRYIREKQEEFSKNTLDFLYYQLTWMYDANPSLYSGGTKLELWKLFLEIVEKFAGEVTVSLEEIPEQDRDSSLILVIMVQCVLQSHAPTITALDRCRILQEKMGKRVLVINTSEAANLTGRIPLAEIVAGNNENLEEQRVISWKNAIFPYYQCKQGMPDMDVINQLLQDVRNLAPQRVILIGGSSILGNLIDRMIPALTISTGFSDLAITGTRYQTVGRAITEKDEEMLKCLGYNRTHVIEGVFTFDIKPQKEKISRQEASIPENRFVLVIVGTRLDKEVSEEFLQMLDHVLDENMYVAFLGNFSGYEERMQRFINVGDKSVAWGSCRDVVARLEICDLYLNPGRKGGGSSAVEAMYMEKPVLSVAYGDVALNAGNEFCVNSYEEMEEKISRYCKDRAYYTEMAKKAKERADILLDTEKAFREIMQEYERREAGRI